MSAGPPRGPRRLRLALALLALGLPLRALAQDTVLDDFEDLSAWAATASEGARVTVAPDAGQSGRAMRIDFELESRKSFVIVRRELRLDLPANYAFTLRVRGEAPRHTLEFKLVGPSSSSVWWARRSDHTLPADWAPIVIRKSRLQRAWGVTTELERIAALEIAITGIEGGGGSLWIDELHFEAREPAVAGDFRPLLAASSAAPGHLAEHMQDGDPESAWRSAPDDGEPFVVLDLGANREYGGLVLEWDETDFATEYRVDVSSDGATWWLASEQRDANGGRDYVRLPDGESRLLRLTPLRASRGKGVAIAELSLEPEEYFASPEPILRALARQAPVGWLPKYWYDRQTYWTVVGVPADRKEALVNEEGMIEVDQASFSIEPFLLVDGELLSWSDVHVEQSLDEDYLPIPSVLWEHPAVELTISAFASGPPGASSLWASYRVQGRLPERQRVRLVLALRPFQVLPPWQSLNVRGGAAPIREVRRQGRELLVNGETTVRLLHEPERIAVLRLDESPLPSELTDGRLAPAEAISSPEGFACPLLVYDLDLEPASAATVSLQVPWYPESADPFSTDAAGDPTPFVQRELEATRVHWRETLNRVGLRLPPGAERLVRTLRTQLAYALIHQDGPALQPGSRNYARSWIRDGTSIALALLSMGISEPVREYLRWYASYQYPDGKIPCCIDQRGPDPTPEHDSAGQFVITVAHAYRFTRDGDLLREMWPHVTRAVDYLIALRERRRTPEYRAAERRAFFGLLPESISHEGYAARPVHSYWDDFFALGGFAEAAALAAELGDVERARQLTEIRDAFREDLVSSIQATMERHRIDYVPGSVELGDLDPTSTAIAVLYAQEVVPALEPALRRSFERYWEEWIQRRAGQISWEAYTPYEVRNLSALLAIGEPDRASRVLSFLLADQRPPAWNQWTEIAWRDPTAPNFIGDMPHAWIGSTFVTVVRHMLATERRSDGALVLAGGLLPEWLDDPAGVTVRGLPTAYGLLDYTLRRDDASRLRLSVGGALEMPPGKIVFASPLRERLRSVRVNGKPVRTFSTHTATIEELPAEVELEVQ